MALIEERTGDIFDSPPHSVLIHACNTKGSWGRGVAAAFKRYSPAAYAYQLHHCTHPSSASTPLPTHQRNLVGTCLLIPPFPSAPSPPPSKSTRPSTKPSTHDSSKSSPKTPPTTPAQHKKQFCIACLFTSHGYGKTVDSPKDILQATRAAAEDLKRQIEEHRARPGRTAAQLLPSRPHDGEQKEEGNDKEADVGEPTEAEKENEAEAAGEETNMAGCVSVRLNSGLFGVEWERTKRVLEEVGLEMVVVRPADDGAADVGVKEKGVVKTTATGAKRKKALVGDGGGGGGGGGGEGKKKQTRLRF